MQTTQTTELRPAVPLQATRRRLRPTHMQQRSLWGLVFALPTVVFFALFSIYPIGRTFYLSFFDYSIVYPPRYVGLENFRQIIGDERFNASLLNSFRYVAFT